MKLSQSKAFRKLVKECLLEIKAENKKKILKEATEEAPKTIADLEKRLKGLNNLLNKVPKELKDKVQAKINQAQAQITKFTLATADDDNAKSAAKKDMKESKKAISKKKIIKEFLIKPGSKFSDILALNLFSDFDKKTGGDIKSTFSKEEWTPEAEAVYKKYSAISKKIESAIKTYPKVRLSRHDADSLDATWYDGSDSYQTADEYADNLPEVYEAQIHAVMDVLNNM